MKKNLFPLFRINYSTKRGFSLAETIIALLILSIALFAIAGVPIMSSKLALHATRREQATFLAIQTLDFLESLEYNVAVNSQDVIGEFTRLYHKPVFVQASPNNYIARTTISWQAIAGRNSFTLERPLSKFSSETRKE